MVLLRHPQRDAEDDAGRRHRLSPALGSGRFGEKTLVAAGQCTKVDPTARPAAVGPPGLRRYGWARAAINTGGVGRGMSVAVIGCGGVGMSAIAGSALAAHKVIASTSTIAKWARD